jgi:hypothetical protein
MAIALIVLAVVIVFVIAAVTIGREGARLAAQSPRPVFDLDEAVEWIGDRLPFEVGAQLSHDDVRQVLQWSLDHFAVAAGDEVLVVEDETLAYVQVRARERGFDWTEQQIQAVLDAQVAYLDAIGAVGPAEEQ